MSGSNESNDQTAISTVFVPEFWQDADGRTSAIRQIRARYESLRTDAGGELSAQRDILCQRACFLNCQLESLEVAALRTGELDFGRYIALLNSLVGTLRLLGIQRVPKAVASSLKDYVSRREKKHKSQTL